MINKVNAAKTIDSQLQMHYRFHHKIDLTLFPQVHDFYEIALSTSGTTGIKINGTTYETNAGTLILIKPGDVHSRFEISGNCEYINLAFPKKLLAEMSAYIGMPDMQKRLLNYPKTLKLTLSKSETELLKLQLERLNLCPVSIPHLTHVELRGLLLNIMLKFFLPLIECSSDVKSNEPLWLFELTRKLDDPELLCTSLSELANMSGYTKEHLCREFKKHLSVSPIAYINSKRLNYAANLLTHTDRQVIDIAYASGFQSLSRFYHSFKKEFGMSALAYRRNHNLQFFSSSTLSSFSHESPRSPLPK